LLPRVRYTYRGIEMGVKVGAVECDRVEIAIVMVSKLFSPLVLT